tara:strand:+ start:692 stop:859 length:168 start_codon:yes stop_codon:yes gene_type:complete
LLLDFILITPKYTKYKAPKYFKAINAITDFEINTEMPKAPIAVCTKTPVFTPIEA